MGRHRKSTPINADYAHFGERIRELRESRRMTQEEMSEHMQISKTSVVNYESGTRKIPLSMVIKYAEFFNASIDDLIGITVKTDSFHHVFYNRPNVISNTERWSKELGEIDFSPAEMDELIAFAKYLIHRRDGKR